MNPIGGNTRYRAYRDKRGWVNIENKRTRGLTIVPDEDWEEFESIVKMISERKKREAKA